MTSNEISLANRTNMLFLQSGVLPHFNSAAINNSGSTFQNYGVQWSPNSACAAVLVSFIRISKDYHYNVCLAPFANCQAS